MGKDIRTAILGASGYTGAELLRLLNAHPSFAIAALTAETQAGKEMAEVYPHLAPRRLPKLVKHTEVDFSKIDLVFCCLPHGTTQEIIAGLPKNVRIVDLSADFRLHDIAAYKEWYGHEHRAGALQKDAVYGLTEHYRERIKSARLVANPGCYPTSILLPLLPLLKGAYLDLSPIVVNSLSGISGAGRKVAQEYLFTELDGGVSAYGIGRHRHLAEIEQEVSKVTSRYSLNPVPHCPVSFTPHLVPITRGMLSTIHVRLNDFEADTAANLVRMAYKDEPFMTVLEKGSASTHQVRGTNRCIMSFHPGRQSQELIIVSVIDNLVKGASGQALQNANLMFGLPETTNLEATAIFP
ncbi:MAG: N-acetyl-gamma-glutamyl-phosphate reductase [Alphaproteobacteria bacterium]